MKLLEGQFPSFQSVITLYDKLGLHGQADFAHRFFKRISPYHRRPQLQGSGDEADAFVAHSRQVLNGLANSMGVIDTNVADARRLRSNVDEYQWQVPKTEMLQ